MSFIINPQPKIAIQIKKKFICKSICEESPIPISLRVPTFPEIKRLINIELRTVNHKAEVPTIANLRSGYLSKSFIENPIDKKPKIIGIIIAISDFENIPKRIIHKVIPIVEPTTLPINPLLPSGYCILSPFFL